MPRARAECARSPFSVLKRAGLEEAPNRTPDAKQLSASAAGRSSWTKHPRRQIAVKREQVNCRFHALATGSGQFRAVLRSAAPCSGEAEPATGCQPSLSLVGQVRPLHLEKLTRNRAVVTTQSWSLENVAALGQQIVAAAPSDNPPNEFTNMRPLGQNDARIDIRSIAFGPGNVWLIDKQFQFLANFFASEIMSNVLLYRHRRPVTGVLYLCGNLVRHPRSTGTLFPRIFEDSKPFETAATNEIQ